MSTGKKIQDRLLPQAIAAVTGIALVFINVLRIVRIPITIDETGYNKHESYLDLAREPYGHANNHVLHSMLRKFFADTFGDSVFFLRVDSLLAQIIYLFFTFFISAILFTNKWLRLGCFLVLNVSCLLLFEFWGLSRGYALAISMLTVSMYCLLRYLGSGRAGMLCMAYLAGILAVYSNYSMLNYFAALTGAVIIHHLLFRRSFHSAKPLHTIIISLAAIVLLAALIYVPLSHVYHNGELSFMGNKGLIPDTIASLVQTGWFFTTGPNDTIIAIVLWSAVWATVVLVAGWTVATSRKLARREPMELPWRTGMVLMLLLLLPVVSLVAQHWLLGINYVTDRAALFFVPVFFFSLLYTLSLFRGAAGYTANIVFMVVTAFSVYNFSTRVTITYARQWWFDLDDIHALDLMVRESSGIGRKLKIHTHWYFGPAFYYDINHFYKDKFSDLNWDTMGALGADTTYDYYYIASDDKADSLLPHYHKDTTFVYGGFILYRKN